MRIVLLRDTIRNIAHAVLAVELNDEIYILDNMSDLVLVHLKYEHYVPQYSVNEFYRWAHVSPGLVRQGAP
jgi:predicted transglutaminase-like cysteine proteinase